MKAFKILVVVVVMMGCSGSVDVSAEGETSDPLHGFKHCQPAGTEPSCDLQFCFNGREDVCSSAYVLEGVAVGCDACTWECALLGPMMQDACP